MGEPVFRDHDQAALDDQYNNSKRFPSRARAMENYRLWSEQARARHPQRREAAYGTAACERLDIFPAAAPDAPIFVFLHGGYWHLLDKSDFSFVADGLIPNGIAAVVPNYGLAPRYGMDEIVRQCRAAVAWVWRHARDFDADARRILVAGHSAGGHLAAMMLATDWPQFAPGLPRGLIAAGCAISGLFDLEPIRLSYLNETLRLDREIAARNTPLELSYPAPTPLLLALGSLESGEYHRQTLAMAARWSRLGYPLELRLEAEADHFSVIEPLRDPQSDFVAAQLRLLRLGEAPREGAEPPMVRGSAAN